ncbi:MAG TPA: cyclic pyranopterin monophosphate synthase MoaC [Elusimicrobiales bacterium]|nr:cyclic pyranopterin monophosphate synthase MoaC [Elusimicrobiales bacterium]
MPMVDVSDKNVTLRTAQAQAVVFLGADIIEKIKSNQVPKGNVLEVSRIAGIQAAKKTPDILPMCHNIELSNVNLEFNVEAEKITITSIVKASAKTGVEMEALASVSVAALNIYDMCKMFSKSITISDVELLKKTGGKSGDYLKR